MPRLSQAATNAASAESQQEVVMAAEGIENYELPKTLVTRIAKSAIPENAKMQKEAMHALLKGSTVFINYLAATAHDLSRARGHKSVGAADVMKAIETIEFDTDGLVKFLEADLEAFRAGTKKAKAAKSVSKTAVAPPSATGRKLKIVVAPIQDDDASPGGGAVAPGPSTAREEDEDEEIGEDVDELEGDDDEPEDMGEYDTTKEAPGDVSAAAESMDTSFRSAS